MRVGRVIHHLQLVRLACDVVVVAAEDWVTSHRLVLPPMAGLHLHQCPGVASLKHHASLGSHLFPLELKEGLTQGAHLNHPDVASSLACLVGGIAELISSSCVALFVL